MSPVIQTTSGEFIDLSDPRPEHISLFDISKALSNLTRFTGHAGFYSVAEHSVGVAMLTELFYLRHFPPDSERQAFKAGLFHDASEAYLGDVSSPLKSILPDYQALERRFQEVIEIKFQLSKPMVCGVNLVRAADLAMLELERQVFFGSAHDPRWPGFLPGFRVSRDELDTFSGATLGRGFSFYRDPDSALSLFMAAVGYADEYA